MVRKTHIHFLFVDIIFTWVKLFLIHFIHLDQILLFALVVVAVEQVILRISRVATLLLFLKFSIVEKVIIFIIYFIIIIEIGTHTISLGTSKSPVLFHLIQNKIKLNLLLISINYSIKDKQ